MKDFLSEYGFAILAAIVVILLIAMCTPVGNLIKNQVLGVVDSFAGKTEAKLAAIDDGGAVKVTLKEGDTANAFHMDAESAAKTDEYEVSYNVKDQNGNWSGWVKFTAKLAEPEAEAKKNFDHEADLVIPCVNGNQVKVRVTDTGKGDMIYYESNIVEVRQAAASASASAGLTITE